MVKRAKVTADTYDHKHSALEKLTGQAQHETPSPEVAESGSSSVPVATVASGGINRTYKPTSFYLSDDQLDKLDDLAIAYKKLSRERINRNDIIRALVDSIDLEQLVDILPFPDPSVAG